MKFLVLALCVCAASAAVFPAYKPFNNPVVNAPVVAAEAVASYVAPVAKAVVKTAWEAGKEAEAAVLRQDSSITEDGFNYNFETQNGIVAQASGALKRVGEVDVLTSQGAVKYISPDGTPVVVTYVADENGYQPQGAHLPVAPPVPEAIARALQYIATHYKPAENVKQY